MVEFYLENIQIKGNHDWEPSARVLHNNEKLKLIQYETTADQW